jgi:hypothetical protein
MGLEINEFMAELENKFQVSLPDNEVCSVQTPRELARTIAIRLPAPGVPDCEIEDVVICILKEHAYRARAITLDTHFRDIFP